MPFTRRSLLGLAGVAPPPEEPTPTPVPPTKATYKRAGFRLLRNTGYGVAVRWTSRTLVRKGKVKPFAQAVRDLDVETFVATVAELGAGHVMWAVCGRDFRLCCPSAAVDRLLPGRTCQRDLVGELADALSEKNIKLMLAMDFGAADAEWRKAAGGDAADKSHFFVNLAKVIAELGQRYGQRLIAWWFEDVRKIKSWRPDWAAATSAAKAGFPDRLVGYNTGMQDFRATTDRQDYTAAWYRRVNSYPTGRQTKLGLPWYAMLDWHVDRHSIFASIRELDRKRIMDLDWPAPSAETLADFYKNFYRVGGTVTFNLLMDQDGWIVPQDLRAIRAMRDRLRRERKHR